jgi:hypothetical protein
MGLSFDDFTSVLKAELTPKEREGCVAYAVDQPLEPGKRLEFPGLSIDVPWDSFLAFINRDPMANWGHGARYVLINREGGEIQSFEVRFPPFGKGGELHWRVVYKAPSLPDAAVEIPQ